MGTSVISCAINFLLDVNNLFFLIRGFAQYHTINSNTEPYLKKACKLKQIGLRKQKK